MISFDESSSGRRISLSVTALAILASYPVSAKNQTTSDRPRVSASLVDVAGSGDINTPLFKKIDTAVDAVRAKDGTAFQQLLAPTAITELGMFDGTVRRTKPIGADMIKAVVSSCLGPYPIAEGSSWVQFSFVCRVDAKAPVAAYIRFENSPELSMTAEWKKGRIVLLTAAEVIPIPGRPLVAMTAFREANRAK